MDFEEPKEQNLSSAMHTETMQEQSKAWSEQTEMKQEQSQAKEVATQAEQVQSEKTAKQTEQKAPTVEEAQSEIQSDQPQDLQQSTEASTHVKTVQQEAQVQQTQVDNQPKVFQYTPYTTPHIVQEQPQVQQTESLTQQMTADGNQQQVQVVNEQSARYDQFVATDADAKLRAACADMMNKEPEKYSKIVSDWTAQYNADPLHPEEVVNNVLATYKNDLMPYVEPMMKAEQETSQTQSQIQQQDPQSNAQEKSLNGQTYSSMSDSDKGAFLMTLRKGNNLISGEGFNAATARVQSNQRQQTNSYAGKQTLQFGKMQSRDGRA